MIKDEAGKIQGVRYDELAAMLLNDVPRQQQSIAAQANQLREMQQQIAAFEKVNLSMQAALIKLTSKEERLASR